MDTSALEILKSTSFRWVHAASMLHLLSFSSNLLKLSFKVSTDRLQMPGWYHNATIEIILIFPCPLQGSFKTGPVSCFIMHDVFLWVYCGWKKTKRRKVLQSIMQVTYWYADKMWQQQRTAWGFFPCPVPAFFIIVLSRTAFPQTTYKLIPKAPNFSYSLCISLMWLKSNKKVIIFSTNSDYITAHQSTYKTSAIPLDCKIDFFH